MKSESGFQPENGLKETNIINWGNKKKECKHSFFFQAWLNIPNYFLLPLVAAIESAFLIESATRIDSELIAATESALRIESA